MLRVLNPSTGVSRSPASISHTQLPMAPSGRPLDFMGSGLELLKALDALYRAAASDLG